MSSTLTRYLVPTGREEAWRFTPLDRLRGLHEAETLQNSVEFSWTASGCTVDLVDRSRLGQFAPVDRVAETGWMSTQNGLRIDIAREVTGATAVVDIAGNGTALYGHISVLAEPFSEATVVLRHAGTGSAVVNVCVDAGDGARVTVVSVQSWDSESVHLGHHAITVGRDASVRHAVVSLGGDLVRLLPTVRYAAPGGSAELLGIFVAADGQHLEHRLHVEHEATNCKSNVAYKGAISGDGAHSVWVGDVLVRKQATGTDTYELNRNLLLSEGARADSVPNLELETGEIAGAGHASATGRFDDDQLFYLQARGIPADVARMLVVRGFLADLVARIGIGEFEAELVNAIETKLESLGLAHVEEVS